MTRKVTFEVQIIGGGTVHYIRPHLALSAPAYGQTVWTLAGMCERIFGDRYGDDLEVEPWVTKMAGGKYLNPDGSSKYIDTNEDVAKLLAELCARPTVKVIFLPVAMCDFEVESIQRLLEGQPLAEDYNVGRQHPRLKTDPLEHVRLELKPAEKIIKRVRKTRKDIFLVGFKTTTGATEQEQFEAGLKLLKSSSCNLVFANDLHTGLNMVITPEQAKYHVTIDRRAALEGLVQMTASRSNGEFTRSTVVPGELVPWNSPEVPESLRTVVNHCIKRGAYRPFLGATVGHFAVKVEDGKFLTSVRKTDFNKLDKAGLVKVETKGDSEVIAYGAKPSVGGQSQRMVFERHPDADCIVHCHVQKRPDSPVPVRQQWGHECGSHACGRNTAEGLAGFEGIKAVYLDKHGPNIVFNRNVDPQKVIEFIEKNFDLDHQTSELS